MATNYIHMKNGLGEFIVGLILLVAYGVKNKASDLELAYISVIGIVLYGKYARHSYPKDGAEKSLIAENTGNMWQLSHLVFYALLGYLHPGQYVKYTTYGIAWELIETYIGTHNITLFGKRFFLAGVDNGSSWSTVSNTGWWYGSTEDIAYNSIGYVIGNYLHANLGKKDIVGGIISSTVKDASRLAPLALKTIGSMIGLHLLLAKK